MRISAYVRPELLERVPGDSTGLAIPAHPDALRAAGPDFLTEAFRRFGALGHDNRVTRIVRAQSFVGGNSGDKLELTVEYAHPAPALPTELFVKFSRAFEDGFLDRRRFELEPEVRLAQLSRHPAFPVRTPTALFADFHHASGTGLLISERVQFGVGEIEPLVPKCLDHELTDPIRYYRATVTALARLAGAQKAGRLSPQAETLFPFNRAAAMASDPINWTEAQLREQVSHYAAFVERHPQLMPASLRTSQFIDRWEEGAVRVLRHHGAIRSFLHADPDLIALCHWNAHIDNAWFWRDPAGVLQCGLFDWGRVRQMNVVYALWGCFSGADLAIWEGHIDELLQLFADQFEANGGPRLDLTKLKRHFDLYVAIIGLSHLMDAPAVVLARLPAAAQASGPHDEVFRAADTARAFMHTFTVFLNAWDRRRLGELPADICE